ncbi:DUF4013 domain-containing protein [Halopiger goleimassiliensis]|uniref:DUF4013 domain-containing protein n=1 Tax=Halopiger goleimassiliensis TaxID=1293048 RepID=UPI000678070A|nr:DUF4013 domain-containing protein [Halopiger goleimassiliensis]
MALLVNEGMRYPFRGDRSPDLLATGGLLGLVAAMTLQLTSVSHSLPLAVVFLALGTVPVVALLGYLFRVVATTIDGADTPPGFRPVGTVFRDGCRLLAVTLGYAAVGGVIVAATVGGLLQVPVSADSLGFAGSLLFFTGTTVVLVLVVTVGYVYPAAVGYVATGGRLAGAADVHRYVPILGHSGYFMAWTFAALFVVPGWAFLLAALSRATAFGVVAIFVAFYAHVVAARLVARGYRSAVEDAAGSID